MTPPFHSDTRPSAILVHRCETGATGDEVRLAEAKQGLGYHYFIRRSGLVDRLYSWGEPVWHALQWSHTCVGIALHGDFDPREGSRNATPTAEQVQAAARLCADLFKLWNPMPVLGHTELPNATAHPDKQCPGSNLNVREIERGAMVLWLRDRLASQATANGPT